MLIWSRTGRTLTCTLAVTLFALFFCLPLAVILMSSLSEQWNGVLPSGFTLSHFHQAFSGASWDALVSSRLSVSAPACSRCCVAPGRRWRCATIRGAASAC